MQSLGSSLRSFAGRFGIAVVVGSLLMTAAVAGVNEEIGNKIDRIPKIDLVTAPERPGGANYLLVGSDTRGFVKNDLERDAFGDAETESGQRSDTIMVIHVEPKAERTFVLSFPRDLWVDIPGHGSSKINAAYNYGPQVLIDTLDRNFDIQIQHFIELDFKTFVDLVNALGSVTVYVPYPTRDSTTLFELPNPGCVSLDGEQSLQWVRMRYLEYEIPGSGRWVPVERDAPDIHRIGRQQEFMRKLAGLAVQKSLKNPFTANVVADQIVNGLKADDAFDKGSVFALLDAFRTLNPDDQSALEFATVPWKAGVSPDGQSVLYVKQDDPLYGPFLDRLRTFSDTPKAQPAPSTVRVRVVNASGKSDLAVAVTARLQELGFATVEPVETSSERIRGVDVRLAPDQRAKGNLLLRYLEPTAQLTVVGASDVDVTIVLGKAFERIAVPADALEVPDTTASAPAAPTEEPGSEVVTPSVPTTTIPPQFPPPAPRGAC